MLQTPQFLIKRTVNQKTENKAIGKLFNFNLQICSDDLEHKKSSHQPVKSLTPALSNWNEIRLRPP